MSAKPAQNAIQSLVLPRRWFPPRDRVTKAGLLMELRLTGWDRSRFYLIVPAAWLEQGYIGRASAIGVARTSK
jgi:hypothetical protein